MLPQNPCLSLACWPPVCLLLLIGTPCVGQEEDTLGRARRLYLSIGDAERALELTEDCLDEQQPQRKLLALVAGMRLKGGDHVEAARLYGIGAQHWPHSDQWLKSLARIYMMTDDNDRLVPALTRLAELDSDNLTIRKKLARTALQQGNPAAVLHWANLGLQINVMDAELHAWRGAALLDADRPDQPDEPGQLDHAVQAWRTAIRLQPSRNEWRLQLASAHVAVQQLDRAREVILELLRLAPDYPGGAALLDSLDANDGQP